MEFGPPGVVVGRGTLDERARARVVLQIVGVQIGPTWPPGDHKDRRRREREGRDRDAQTHARVREAHDRPIRSSCEVRTYTIAPITITDSTLTARSTTATPIASCCARPKPWVSTQTIAISTSPKPAGVSGRVVSRDVATATKTTPDSGRSRPSAVSTKK